MRGNIIGFLFLAVALIGGWFVLLVARNFALACVVGGGIAFWLDIAYRNSTGSYMHPFRGGNLMFIPIWLIGIAAVTYGAYGLLEPGSVQMPNVLKAYVNPPPPATTVYAPPTATTTTARANEPIVAPTSVPPSPTEVPVTSIAFTADFTICNMLNIDDAESAFKCENGAYKMSHKVADRFRAATPPGQFGSAVVEASAMVPSGDITVDYGIVFRVSNDGTSLYYFRVSPQGYFSVSSLNSQTWTSLIPATQSNAIKKGAGTNRLKVIAQGNQFALFLNDQFLDTLTDSTLSSGRVGIALGSQNPNVLVQFNSLSVSTINRPLTLPAGRPTPSLGVNWDQLLNTPTPTAFPTIPSDRGLVIVDNFCGFDVYLDIAGKLYNIPVNGKLNINLPPGHYPISATANGQKLVCGGAGCSLDVEAGKYTPYPYCSRPAE